MRAVVMIVPNVFVHQTFQMTLIEDGYMIEQVPTAAANPTLGNAILPRLFTVAATSVLKFVARSKIR